MSESFAVKDCALLALSTGKRAQNLRELRDRLREIDPDSIYYHFWGGLLRPTFENPEYPNDFAQWAHYGLHDERLAERLSIIDPTDFETMENLRLELIDVIEERLDETEMVPWARNDKKFQFTRAQIVVFDTQMRLNNPQDLKSLVPHMSVSSVFYHFVDARTRTPGRSDDFSTWLENFGDQHTELLLQLSSLDPYFKSLSELREQLSLIVNNYIENGAV